MHPTPATSPQQPEHRPAAAPATSATSGTEPTANVVEVEPTATAQAIVPAAVQPAAGELARLAAQEAGTQLTPAPTRLGDVVPAPEQVRPEPAADFTLPADTTIRVSPAPTARAVAERLAGLLRPATGYPLPVVEADHPEPAGGLALVLAEQPALGLEGYQLDVTPTGVRISAATAAGLHHGTQTLRQLLPAAIESTTPVRTTWTLPGGSITDRPRFPYRGAMLDVARHFFGVDEVLRVIDHLARYKLNHLHLHLTDDQGWRIAVESRPRLTTIGGSTAVGDAPGGWYTPADYQRIVAYAADRHLTVVPEIDLPGHTNAALTAYPELAPDGTTPAPYTGTDVGFSYVDPANARTYEFVTDVLEEVAARTPGPFLHIGGDEAFKVKGTAYTGFVERVQHIVAGLGKTVVGWHQLAPAAHNEGRVLQWWGTDGADPATADAVRRGARLILSPGNHAYLDMKYAPDTPIGHDWAGLIDVRRAYDWDPATQVADVPAAAVLGVEAPLWTESVTSLAEVEFMLLPRLPAIAELGWSPRATHDWAAFRARLAGQGPRWASAGIAFHRSPEIPWPGSPTDPPAASVPTPAPRPRDPHTGRG
ncbi:beta-N-acetylhexosaminidase [Salinispora arenicola]|uniref:beta-N-acetylhexosaminidase n=1 Tax=Salinispora arenicola TaxID=168697 RepID=UPI00207AA2CC|nr:beta-N-acetylhexosaminidase [Salinispora arenicola]MCN0151822.1 beta-N-acetylhexosaminidase [Salinispora arenicola]